ncbi:MAG: zeta toxin family protein [Bacteroidota bacterium]
MPILTVIAGPNGAGKSFNSQLILSDQGIHSFDFDFEFNSRWKQYSYDPFVERGVREYVGELFLERKQEAIKNTLNFSFETNYHDQEVHKTVQDFKSAGYFTELVFMFLRNTGQAIQRVKDRVARGGHSVDEETIIDRFDRGLQLLDSTFQTYDLISLYLSDENQMTAINYIEPPNNNVVEFQALPLSLIAKLPRLAKFIRDKEQRQ